MLLGVTVTKLSDHSGLCCVIVLIYCPQLFGNCVSLLHSIHVQVCTQDNNKPRRTNTHKYLEFWVYWLLSTQRKEVSEIPAEEQTKENIKDAQRLLSLKQLCLRGFFLTPFCFFAAGHRPVLVQTWIWRQDVSGVSRALLGRPRGQMSW